jgi:hypothetical protein
MKETPGRRKVRLGVLGINTARCGKCLADCKDELDGWLVFGTCEVCRTMKDSTADKILAAQQRIAGG